MNTGIEIQDSRRPFYCLDAPTSVLRHLEDVIDFQVSDGFTLWYKRLVWGLSMLEPLSGNGSELAKIITGPLVT